MINQLQPRRRNRIEHDHQVSFFEWLRFTARRHPILKLFFAIPNGGARDHGTAVAMFLEGAQAGVLDTHLPVARQGKNGLWIEFKSDRGELSTKQHEFRELLEAQNHRVEVVREWAEAARITVEYLGLEGVTVPAPPRPMEVRR